MATAVAEKRVERVRITPRLFGVEIECCCDIRRGELAEKLRDAGITAYSEDYNHATVDYWKIITDSSIVVGWGSGQYGMELVSPPLSGKRGLRQLKTVLDVLKANGGEVNNTCGLHVHHDVTHESYKTLRELVAFYGLYEKVVDKFVHPNRRDNYNDYCRSVLYNGGGTFDGLLSMLDHSCQSLDDLSYEWGNRQVTLNVQPAYHRGTVEFRHHDATLEYADIAYWLAFTQSILEAASKGEFHITRSMRSNKDRMFRNAHVQPIVRWHFNEREEMLRNAYAEPFYEGEYSEDRDYEDEDESYEEDPWGDSFESDLVQNDNGLWYDESCHCPVCTARRGY